MSEIKKITYKSISSALNKKEMKNVLGGSWGWGSGDECACGSSCPDPMELCLNNPGNPFVLCSCQNHLW